MDRRELLEHYRRTRDQLLGVIEGLSDEAMIEPSLDGWSVKDHLLHVAAWDDLRTGDIRRVSGGYDAAWPRSMTRDQVEAFNLLTHEMRVGLSLPQALWELEMSRRTVLEAIEAAPERGLDPSLYGHLGLASTHEAEHADMIGRWRSAKGL